MKKIISIVVILLCINTKAQQNYVHYTVKNGLPQMQCMKLFQDSKGYIWIATKGGVSKYDGIQFKNYSINEGLPNNRIFDIKEDSNGQIYVFTQEGVSVLKDHKFYFSPPKDKELLFDINFTKFIIDKNNKLWFFDVKRQKLIQYYNGIYNAVINVKQHDLVSIYKLSYDHKNDLIYFKGRNVNKDENYYSINISDLKMNKLSVNFNNINHNEHVLFKNKRISETEKNNYIYQFNNIDTLKLGENKNGFRNVKRLNDSTIIYTNGNVNQKMPLYYLINGKFKTTHFIENYYNQINHILIDSEKNIWIASEKGLFKLTPFNNFTEKDGMPNYVWTIQEDANKKIWFSSYANKYLSYRKDKKIIKYSKGFGKSGFYLGALKSVSNDLYFSHRNNIVHYNGKHFSSFNLPKNAISMSMFEDTKTNEIYFGSNKGLFIRNNKGKIFNNKAFEPRLYGTIHEMVKNKKNEIWYVSRKSIGIVNQSSVSVKNDSIKGAVAIYCDFKDNLWIGTENGLYFYDYHQFIKVKHAELNTFILSIVETDNKHFVYGGMRGIGILDLELFYKTHKNKKLITEINAENFVNYYTQSHGFLGEEIGQNGMFKDSENQIWIPTNNNVVMFHPKDLKKNTKEPYTYITDIKMSIDNMNWEKISDDKPELNYKQRNIHINFTGISHTSPDMVRYKYRLKGFSDSWCKPTKKREVTFTNLNPNKYTFELLASNGNGVWNKNPVIKKFTITSVFWKTIWFRFMLFAIILFGIYMLVSLIYKRNRKKSEINERLNNLQLKAIQSQLYPHLLFNAVSAAGSVIYKENKEKAYDFVVKLSQFMRSALEDSKKLYKSLQEELNFVESYLQLQKIRFSERFNYEITIDNDIDLLMQIPQMIIQTYVENAVKHGLEPLKEGGFLKINIVKNANEIQFIIEDNGIGIEKAKSLSIKSTGSGIKIMNEIYEIHNEKKENIINYELIDLYKTGGKGTRSVIHIKLNNG